MSASLYEAHTYSGFEPTQIFDVVYGGHFEHRLISSNRADLVHRRLVLGDVRVESGTYNFAVIGQGAMPQDTVCIGLVDEGMELTRCNLESIGEDEVQVYAPGAELTYHATGASRWINVAMPEAKLQEMAMARLGRPISLAKRGFKIYKLLRESRIQLQQLCYDALDLAAELAPTGGIAPQLAREMSRAFVTAYVDALGTAHVAEPNSKSATAQRHHQLILACERLLLGGGVSNVNLSEIARRSGYSQRSLELIFQNAVGMTPGRWFANIRLNGALRELVAAAPDCSVTSVATRWGFRHLSRFAEHYRRTFGELPSETLSRALTRQASR
ncbi:MAG: helix-turn-helix transcriptional regulator [Proteobacteria bacterium]|nr:helix-turn-helix transcriptional regulator [Pseudomonadota bacterium]